MGRDGYYWSVDEARWLPSPQTIAPEQASSPEQPVVAEVDTA
ncbi:MAG: hypothetical protein ACJ735_07155 [Actinomycetes bacterium]